VRQDDWPEVTLQVGSVEQRFVTKPEWCVEGHVQVYWDGMVRPLRRAPDAHHIEPEGVVGVVQERRLFAEMGREDGERLRAGSGFRGAVEEDGRYRGPVKAVRTLVVDKPLGDAQTLLCKGSRHVRYAETNLRVVGRSVLDQGVVRVTR